MNDLRTVLSEYATEGRFLARRLTAWGELYGPLVEDVVIDILGERQPARILDVGCGTGDFSERVHREVAASLVVLDLSPRMVQLAHARGLAAVTGDIQALPLAKDTVDCVVANRVLYHLRDADSGVAEIARVLRPHGLLVAVTYAADHLGELWDLLGERAVASSPFSDENGDDLLRRHFDAVERQILTGDVRFPTRDSILGLLASYGDFAERDLPSRLGAVAVPFRASYRHCVFLAQGPLERSR